MLIDYEYCAYLFMYNANEIQLLLAGLMKRNMATGMNAQSSYYTVIVKLQKHA